jgi:hypothetical protein
VKWILSFVANIIAFMFIAGTAIAGQIELKNGDKMGGQLKSLGGDNLIWKADKVGEVTIKKSDVNNISVNEPLKLRGFDEPCVLKEFANGMVKFDCNNQAKEYSLLSLHDVIPYSSFEESFHSYGGKLTIVGAEKTGNVESSSWLVGTEVKVRHNDFRHDIQLRYTSEFLEIEQEEGVDAVDSNAVEYYQGFYGINWFFLPRWYLLGDLAAEKDDAKQIAERYIAGLGSGFQWWETPITALKLEASILQTKEYFDLTAADIALGSVDRKDFASARLAADFRYKFLRDIALFQRTNISQNLEDIKDWRAAAETGLSAPLGFGISASLLVNLDYLNDPQEGVEKSDTTYRVGIVYSW